MDRLVRIVSSASRTGGRSDEDDFADRLSSRYTVCILILFAVLVGMNQYVRNPITCWTPNHFTGSHNRYTNSYCWIRNTYYLPWSQRVPPAEDGRRPVRPVPLVQPVSSTTPPHASKQEIPYYQWIPFILLAQAALFYAPGIIWRAFNSKAGVDSDSIMAAAHTLARADKPEVRERTLTVLTKYFDRFLGSRRDRDGHCEPGIKCLLSFLLCKLFGRRVGGYLLILFLISKLFYIANVIGQLFLLNRILATQYNIFGVEIVKHWINYASEKRDWSEDESHVAFPRVTLCDINVRGQDIANVQPYTIQCVLPINTYTEKVYAFLWFWMVFVALMSCVSLAVWICRVLFAGDRVKFIKNHLYAGGRIAALPKAANTGELVRKFTREYLRQDGSFLLRLIAHNTDNITTTELICAIWDNWKDQYVGSVEPLVGNNHKGLYPDASALDTVEMKRFDV